MSGNEGTRRVNLETSMKLFDLNAGADKLYRLVYPSRWLIPLKAEAVEDNAIFTYDLDALKPISSINKSVVSEKLRLLLNIAGLLNISEEYSFSLNPENLYINRNLEPKVLFRDLNGEENRHDFIAEYKALIGCCLYPRYQFDDYLKGGESLYKKKKRLRSLKDAKTVEEIEGILKVQFEHEVALMQKQKLLVNRKSHTMMRVLTPALLIVSLISGGFAVYMGYIALPYQKALLDSEHYFLRGDYDSAIGVLKNTDPVTIPKEERYQLARAYVISESLSQAQKNTILSDITIKSEDNVLLYWIHIGRMEYESAIDMAKRIGSDEMLLYALISHEVSVQNNIALTGEEKSTLLEQLTRQISDLEKAMTEKTKTIEEADSGLAESEAADVNVAEEQGGEHSSEAESEAQGEEEEALQ